MEKHRPDDEGLILFRNEAKRLLGIEEEAAKKEGKAQPEEDKAAKGR